ncbi:Hypothetical predicted protein [Marmota monax]|uniref:Uncharacterized protein n=1 Tax=Marmota monax TaxID=9995 RepID=A0A5E4CEA8_MARMO|nr:hypothetical protein GHT09_004451 [Marmota monax]VTJ79459.1 Hypothetical predicted protein [Marmota monax]
MELSPRASASPDLNSPGEEEIPLLPGTHLQAGPCKHRCQTLPEPTAWTPGKATSPKTLEDSPLLMELQKLPGMANTDLGTRNPNIQVRAAEGPLASGHLERSWAGGSAPPCSA